MSVYVWIKNYCSISIYCYCYLYNGYIKHLRYSLWLYIEFVIVMTEEGGGYSRDKSLASPCHPYISYHHRVFVFYRRIYNPYLQCPYWFVWSTIWILNVFDLRSSTMSNVVQYVLVRGDLTRTLKWPSGAVMAQACHACVAVVHTYYSDPDTQAYLKDLENMHKVILEVSPSPLIF